MTEVWFAISVLCAVLLWRRVVLDEWEAREK